MVLDQVVDPSVAHPSTWSPSLEWTYGRPRLRGIREMMSCSDLNVHSDVDLVIRAYEEWVMFHEYLLLEAKSEFTGEKLRIGVLCSKRGNVVHARRLDRKLGFLNSGKLKGIRFFDASDFKLDRVVKTRLLWGTFTNDSKRGSCRDSWNNNTHDMQLVLKRLRHEYGRVEVLCFPQAFPDPSGSAYGYVHNHAVLYFKDHEFTVFPALENVDGREKLVYRVNERDEIKDVAAWHSFVDVKALSSMKGAVNYCRAYGQKAVSGENHESNVNNAMAWLMGKHGYTMSHGFRKSMLDLIKPSANSAMGQLDLFGNEIEWTWHCYGVWSWQDLIHGSADGHPPWVLSVSEDLFNRCREQFHRGSNTL